MRTLLATFAVFTLLRLAAQAQEFPLNLDGIWRSDQRGWGDVDFKNGSYGSGAGALAVERIDKTTLDGKFAWLVQGTWTSARNSGRFYVWFSSPDRFSGDYTTGTEPYIPKFLHPDDPRAKNYPNFSGKRKGRS